MSDVARCTGEAVSWLRLERYHLRDVDGDEQERIRRHLDACAACAACLDRIEKDEAVALPALRPLPSVAPPRGRWLRVASVTVGAMAAAAVLVLVLRERPRPNEEGPLASNGVKGDAVAFSLVRDDGQSFSAEGGVFEDGDRFKAIVTCPPGSGLTFDLVVYDRGGASFPLERAERFGCGNEVPLAGAFRLTGREEERVCLVWGAADAVKRDALADQGLPDGVKRECVVMSPGE